MTKVQIAAALLEIEARVMECRASVLLNDQPRFWDLLLEIRAKAGALCTHLMTEPESVAELFAVSSQPAATSGAQDADANPELTGKHS